MPPKIRELISQLEQAGFTNRGGKGSHRNYAHPKLIKKMKDSAKYIKIVAWSEEDNCYVGSCPGLIYGGCHGDEERLVFDELCQIVEEVIELYKNDLKTLPTPTIGKDYVNILQHAA